MSRPLRHFAVFQRQFSRSHFPSNQNGSVRVQRVRILRPFLRNRFLPRFLFWMVAANAAWLVLERRQQDDGEQKEASVSMKEAVDQVRAVKQTGQVGPAGDVSAGTEEEVEAVSEGEDEEGWEDEDLVPEKQPEGAWFVPLWFAQTRPTVNYTAEDEEFRLYAKFNDNPALIQHTKARLIAAIHQTLANARDFQRLLGAPVLIGKRWIDLQYPSAPPPEYERLGIEVTDDYVALLYRPVEQRNYARLQNALLPSAAAESFFWSTWALLRLQHGRLQELFGGDAKAANGKQSQESSSAGAKTPPTAEAEKPPNGPSKTSQDARQTTKLPLPGLPTPHEDLKKSVYVFRRWFAQKSRVSVSPPRGTILFTGWVELVGKHGEVVVRVQAVFDPKEGKFQHIVVSPRRPTQRKLLPKK